MLANNHFHYVVGSGEEPRRGFSLPQQDEKKQGGLSSLENSSRARRLTLRSQMILSSDETEAPEGRAAEGCGKTGS